MRVYQKKYQANSLVSGIPHFIFIVILLFAPRTIDHHPSISLLSFLILFIIVSARVSMVFLGKDKLLHKQITTVLILTTAVFWSTLYILELQACTPLTPHQFLLLFIILGIISAGSLSMYQLPKLNTVYMLVLVVPGMISSIIYVPDLGKIFAFMLGLYAAFMQVYVNRQNKVWQELIIEKKKSEENALKLESHKASLEEKNVKLDQALTKAEASTKAKSLFLASMSHEIRTPLNGIMGMIDLVKKTKLTAEQKEYISDVEISSIGLLTIINDILDFSKIEAGQIHLEKVNFCLDKELKTIEKIFKLKLEEKKLEYDLFIDDNLPSYIIGDPVRLKQILINLVSNAIKFTNQGGIYVFALLNQIENDQVKITFKVKDTGIGLSDEDKSKLFKAFSQVDITHSRKYGGTGLGLAISKDLAELMGGEISVKSEYGKGSEFTFSVILSKGEKPDKNNIDGNASSNDNFEKMVVLIAEDNLINQKVAAANIMNLGHECEIAENGKIAFEKYMVKDYDLILMDISMPELDGIEATKLIRIFESENHKARVPIIAMTANAMKEDREKCLLAGMDEYIAKPFNIDELIKIIRNLKKK